MAAALSPVSLLILAVLFVNGWTDAPNAIATAVGSGALSFRRAAALAAVCNFLGAGTACLFFPAVAASMEELILFSGGVEDTRTVLCAALLSVILWAVLAWRFGLPTSESHALMAALAGGGAALGESARLQGAAWSRVLLGLILSLLLGAGFAAWAAGRLSLRSGSAVRWQRLAAAGMAFLHGAQDGQKFLSLLLMAGPLPASPLLPALLCAGVMGLGTGVGGAPIVKKVGSELTRLSPELGLAADLGGGASLLLCTLLGLPVSTTHTKVAAVCGVGLSRGGRGLAPGPAREMAGAWLLTFPVCAALSWLLVRLMTG